MKRFSLNRPPFTPWKERVICMLYEALTQAIVALGAWRERLVFWFPTNEPKGRVFDVYRDEVFSCCDCGLEHRVEYFGPDHDCGHQPAKYAGKTPIVGHMYPRRPNGYGYRWRKGAGSPDLALPKEPVA